MFGSARERPSDDRATSLDASRLLNIPASLASLISLAQHYEWPSSMVDVTSSPVIATWFATHDWATGEPSASQSSRAVIYRFGHASTILDRANNHAIDQLAAEISSLRSGAHWSRDRIAQFLWWRRAGAI
jgi:hypothetical protein